MRRSRRDDVDGEELAELAALADGSLAPERRAALEARVAASPELAELLAEQQRAVAFTRSAAADVEAPDALRTRIDEARPSSPPARRSRPRVDRRRCGSCGGGRHRRGGVRFRRLRGPVLRCACADGSGSPARAVRRP